MAKKISNKDIFEEGLFAPAVKNAEELNKELAKLEAGLKGVASVAKKDLKNVKIVNFSDIDKGTKAIKEADAAFKGIQATEKEQIKLKKQLNQLSDEEVKGKLRFQQANKAQRDSLKDLLVLQDKSAGTLQKVAAQNRILRREREKLNLDTEKGRKRLKEINAELDKNNKKILENSDKLKKQKLNVGNYSASIKEAAEASGLFGGILGKLNQIQAVVAALTKTNTVEQGANTVSKEANAVATTQLTFAQRALSVATGVGTKALKAFKLALASTGIGLIVIALGSLVAFFTRAQSGVDGLSKAFAGLTAGIDVIIDRFEQVGSGIVDIVKGIATFDSDSIAAGFDKISTAAEGFTEELAKETALAIQLKELTIELTREQKLFEAEQAKSLSTVKELTIIAKDKLAADQDRLDAVKEINEIEIEVAEKQLALQERALAASLDSVSADQKRLQLGAEQLEFIDRIKAGQIEAAEAVQLAADFTLSSAAGEEALFAIVEQIVAQEQARQSLLDKQATTAKRTAAIVQQIANKNSKALLQEAKLRQLISKDEDETIDNRIDAINEVRDLTIKAAKARRDANIINEQEFQALRLTEIKRAEEAIQKLQAKTDKVTDDSREKALKKQVENINKIEQEQFKGVIEANERLLDNDELTASERLRIIEETAELRKSQIIAQAEFEKSLEGKTAEEIELINLQLANDIAAIDAETTKNKEEELKKQADAEDEANQKKIDKAFETANKIADLTKEATKEAFDAEEKALEESIARREEVVAQQQRRAEQGLDNQLAFEKQKLAQQERERAELAEKRAKAEEAQALAQAFLNAFQARVKDDPDTAGAKALTDVIVAKALSETIAGAFAEGVEDFQGAGTGTSDSNIIRFSHGESVVTAKATKENKGLVTAMNNGDVGSWFASNMMLTPLSKDNNYDSFGLLANKIDSIEKAIRSRPTTQTNLDNMGNVLQSTYKNGIKNTVKYVNKPGII